MRALRRRPFALGLAGFCVLLLVGSALAAKPGGGGATVTITDVAAAEGNSGVTAFAFTISRTGSTKATASVAYTTVVGTASAGTDFTATSGTLSFARGVRARTVTVQVVGDESPEPDETFRVDLSAPVGVGLADGSALGTIVDDDMQPAGPVVAVAGDIACDPADGNVSGASTATCQQRATSDLLLAGDYAAILTVGDNQYETGSLVKYQQVYDPSWGRVRALTRPTAGNHEYGTAGASGYFDYFGAAAGTAGQGWYSYDVGDWHLVALNSNCGSVGGCGSGSPQEQWLRADLAAHPNRCTLAYWHHPRFSSGASHGSSTATQALWQALHDGGADLVLAGHEHNYERLGPLDAIGGVTSDGLRSFVVGTGGKSHYGFATVVPGSEVRDATSYGILELTLGPAGFAWRFRAAVGSFTDSGTATCR